MRRLARSVHQARCDATVGCEAITISASGASRACYARAHVSIASCTRSNTFETHVRAAGGGDWARHAVNCYAGHGAEDLGLLGTLNSASLGGSTSAVPPLLIAALAPGAIVADWAAGADAALVMFLTGQETGHAFADLLLGDSSPDGRLPLTIPASEADTVPPCTAGW